jgi:predicted metal-dependent HD superfamily phosphohydrolase
MNELGYGRWAEVWRRAVNRVAPIEYFDRLTSMFSERHRQYHNCQHVAECLEEFDRAKHLAMEPVAVELAIWFHDAVYDPRAGDNEERSADLAAAWLNEGSAPASIVDSVRTLVLATKRHDGSGHVDAPLVVDVDLSILGREQKRFLEYEDQIRAEYAWVDPVVFAEKRSTILEQFMARPRIYGTDWFFERYERQARLNLADSIRRLRSNCWR